jgi:hypothetical protein
MLLVCVVVVVVAVGSVMGACDPSDQTTCATFLNSCSSSAADQTAQCTCLDTYIACSNATGCLTANDLAADVNACATLGCDCQSVGGSTPMPTRSPLASCNQTFYYECSSAFVTCGFTKNVCACYSAYINGCVVKSGCETAADTLQISQLCRTFGCTAGQCQIGANKCNSNGASACASTLRKCSSSGNTCQCYVQYIGCMKLTNCLTPTQLMTTENACASAGCVGCFQ